MKRPRDQERWGRRLRRWADAERAARTSGVRLPPFEVWRSRDFLAQLFLENGHVRVSVNRTVMPNGKDWADGISWDELQRLKDEIGRGGVWAVEVFPPDVEVVNDAPMRHLWLLDEPPPYGWKLAE